MSLVAPERWPKNGVLIESDQTKASVTVMWVPHDSVPAEPWVVKTYLEWGPDESCAWSGRFSTNHLQMAFGPDTGQEHFFRKRFYRSRFLLTLPPSQQTAVENRDPFCQVFITPAITAAVLELASSFGTA